ncbi:MULTISPECIES: GNAT family N-acetyltransferase [Pseudoalteromonas]|uniref:GNAT family N-acetyltransferase n=1 Tax=Pseudoalteromonas TaxID=53246 RepID=UPI0015FD598D|nr:MULTISPECIES: GNAT family N-acetyltransferase [Pseudoalteromonas]QMW16591.1 GNAT family N-acetyltransferase [Pseudoalteromonas sp. MT33b]|tara:strand:- start:2721 stop:3212 length:492 start_codon:yes stop_codon:yes gene_type:complete
MFDIHLRAGQPGDEQFILSLLNQPSFIKYIGDKQIKTLAQAQHYIQQTFINSHQQFGFGSYVVCLADGTAIGMVGLFQRDALAIPDLGFALLAEYEGQGITTRAAGLLLAKTHVKALRVLVAITSQTNSASQKVLQKLGFEQVGDVIINDDHQPLTLLLKSKL